MKAPVALLALAGCGHPAAPRPPPCPDAPVVVSSQEDLDALAPCAGLPGLTVKSGAPLDLTPLAGLTAIDGDLVIGPTLALGRVALPGLTTVGGKVAIVSGGALGGVFLPALTRAGAIEVRDHPGLADLLLPRLATVERDLAIVRVPTLELVDASALATVGGAVTIAAPALTTWLGAPPTAAGPRTLTAPAFADAP